MVKILLIFILTQDLVGFSIESEIKILFIFFKVRIYPVYALNPELAWFCTRSLKLLTLDFTRFLYVQSMPRICIKLFSAKTLF